MSVNIKALASQIFGNMAKQYGRNIIRTARIEGAILYLRSLQVARLSVLGLVAVIFMASLFALSFLLLHVAIIMSRPWPLEKCMFVLAWFAGFYVVLCIGILCFVGRQSFWMRYAKGNEIASKALRDNS